MKYLRTEYKISPLSWHKSLVVTRYEVHKTLFGREVEKNHYVLDAIEHIGKHYCATRQEALEVIDSDKESLRLRKEARDEQWNWALSHFDEIVR